MKINERIKAYRKSKGISQTYIAEQLGISVSGYSMKESGQRPIDINEIQVIAEALDVSASIFFEKEFHVKCNKNTA